MTIQQLLEITVNRKASDLHLASGFPPLVRVNGDLVPVEGEMALTPEDVESLTSTLLTPTQREFFVTNFELDFSFNFGSSARFRANMYRQQGKVAIALRMIPFEIPPIENLGLPPGVTKLLGLKQGLILVTGPTGQGKSTSLAAMINQINHSRSAHILTIEDPIEYVYPKGKSLISQREMTLDTKNWNGALRSALREDPDVVLVGEMRDYETIAATLTVAETGHLVFATLHTNSAAQSIDRIIDVFPENQQSQVRAQLSSVLEAIISQRLVQSITPGRVMAVELLLRTPALSSMIRDGKTHLIDNMIQTSAELGMVGMESSLAKLVKEGRVSLEEAQTYVQHPELFAKLAT